MTLEEAAKEVSERYGYEPWFQAIGTDQDETLYLYLKKRSTFAPKEWGGYHIVQRVVGQIRPC